MSEELTQRLLSARTPEEQEWLLTQWSLDSLDEELQQAAWAAAIPHWFDSEMLAVLLERPAGAVTELFRELTALSYVERYRQRWYNIHESTRKILLDRLWQSDSSRYRQLSRRAADYCAGHDLDDAFWRKEWIYHLLIAEPGRGVDELRSTGWRWQNPPLLAYDLLGEIVRQANEHGSAGRLDERGLAWIRFWQAHIDLIERRWEAGREKLLLIDFPEESDLKLAADRNRRLGDAATRLARYESARERYDRALAQYLDDRIGKAHCQKSLGDLDWKAGDLKSARGRYKSALSTFRELEDRFGEADCEKALGNADLQARKLPSARRRFEIALDLYRELDHRPGIANSLRSLGDIDFKIGDVESARHQYDAAAEQYRSFGSALGTANCQKALGDIALRTGDISSANQLYANALEQYRESGSRLGTANCLICLGNANLRLGRQEVARDFYQQGVDIYREIGLHNAAIAPLMKLGSLAEAGSPERAQWWNEAEALLQQLAETNKTPVIEQYNYACLQALRGRTKEALASLQACLAAGKISAAHVEWDLDWSALRSNTEFLSILDRYKRS